MILLQVDFKTRFTAFAQGKFPVTLLAVQITVYEVLNVYISRNLKGIIVTLDETGYIYCSYLGTDPSLFVTPPTQSRDVQYDVSKLVVPLTRDVLQSHLSMMPKSVTSFSVTL